TIANTASLKNTTRSKLKPDSGSFLSMGSLKGSDTLNAREPADATISVQNQLTSFEGVLFKVFKPRRQHYPRLVAGAPEIPARQIGKLSTETVNVFGSRKQPDAIRRRLLLAIAQATQELVFKIDVSETKRTLHLRPQRLQFIEHKRKGIDATCCSHYLIRPHLR